jgi:chromosome segregation ATPase
VDGNGRLTELEQRLAALEAINAQLARDLAATLDGGGDGSRARGPAAAALHLSAVERRLEATLAELDAEQASAATVQGGLETTRAELAWRDEELAAERAALAAALSELAAARAEAEAGWGRYYQLRDRAVVRWVLRAASVKPSRRR